MEAQVENNIKHKQLMSKFKEKKRKKKQKHMYSLQSLKNCGRGENICKKELTINWCPWPNTQALLYLVPSK